MHSHTRAMEGHQEKPGEKGKVCFADLSGCGKAPANGGDVRERDSIPGSGRSPGGGHGNPLQYSCLENSMDRGACELFSPYGLIEPNKTEPT